MSQTTGIIDRVDEVELSNVRKSWLRKPSFREKSNNGPVLPVKGKKNVLITSTLLRVESIPHFDDIIGSALSADVFARYCRIRGWNTLYISGVNEHGTEIEEIALKENVTPQAFCDSYFQMHKEIYEWLNISFDNFGRTTAPEQTKFVQEIFKEVHDKGYTTSAYMRHLLCKNCDRLMANQIFKGTCPLCKYKYGQGDLHDDCDICSTECLEHCNVFKDTPIVTNSREIFLNSPEVKARFNDWVDKLSEDWSFHVQVVNKSWLKDDLAKICINWSFKWGISVLDEELGLKVFNDWFASPITYMSTTATYSSKWDQWWMPKEGTEITYYQFMRKDEVALHSVMFPACLFATESNYNFVNHIMATEYFKYEYKAFSKTLDIEAFAIDADKAGLSSDVFRFYMMFIHPESHESSFNWIHLTVTNNDELFNNLGKFCNSTLLMLEKMFNCVIPNIKLKKDDLNFLALVTRDLKEYITMLDMGKLRDGLLLVLSISRHCNKYISCKDLWSLFGGSKNERSTVCTVIGLSCNMVCLLAVLLQPYMPQIANEIGKQINIDISSLLIYDYVPRFLQHGHNTGKYNKIFTYIKPSFAMQLKHQYSQKKNKKKLKKQKNKQFKKKVLLVFSENLKYISSIEQLEAAISEQSDIIHILKQGNTEKCELEPYVRGLLEMKTKLDQMKVVTDPMDTYDLDAEVSLLYPGVRQEMKKEQCVESQFQSEFDFGTTFQNIKGEWHNSADQQ